MKFFRIFHVSDKRGFTLIELLVVLVILGLLAALVGPNIFKNLSKGQAGAAKAQLELLSQALDQFRLDVGRYPTSQEGLNALVTSPGTDNWQGPYLKKSLPNDPWGKPYHYQSPGSHGEFDLLSFGKDGSPGGEGENKDITNWE